MPTCENCSTLCGVVTYREDDEIVHYCGFCAPTPLEEVDNDVPVGKYANRLDDSRVGVSADEE